MTTRSMDRPPNGQVAPDKKRTTQRSIAAIGATGAVLAGGAVGFVFLIGVVSFNAYPKASDEIEGPAAELQVVPLTAAAPAGSPAQQPAEAEPFDVGPLASSGPLPSSGAVAGPPDLGRDIAKPEATGDEPPVVVVAPPAPGDGGSSDPTTGAGSEEPLPQDPGGDDDPSSSRAPSGRRPVRRIAPHACARTRPTRRLLLPPPSPRRRRPTRRPATSPPLRNESESESAGGRGSRAGEHPASRR